MCRALNTKHALRVLKQWYCLRLTKSMSLQTPTEPRPLAKCHQQANPPLVVATEARDNSIVHHYIDADVKPQQSDQQQL